MSINLESYLKFVHACIFGDTLVDFCNLPSGTGTSSSSDVPIDCNIWISNVLENMSCFHTLTIPTPVHSTML